MEDQYEDFEVLGTSDRKVQLDKERSDNKLLMNSNEVYCMVQSKPLECLVYLYKEASPSRLALVFHFKNFFNINVEGVIADGTINNIERFGLPSGNGTYYKLTQQPTKLEPVHVINTSKANKFNNTSILNQRDWNFQLLASLHLDNLVQVIYEGKYAEEAVPLIEETPNKSLCGKMISMATDALGYFQKSTDPSETYQNQGKSKHKIISVRPLEITVPHVPSEYDEKKRDAVIIKYIKEDECAIIIHFQGDDSFRTVKGMWNEDILKPSFQKVRPKNCQDAKFTKIGTIETSPAEIRTMTLDNLYNGCSRESGITEEDWARQICQEMKLLDNWHSDCEWNYEKPPQYTVGPDKNVYGLFCSIPTS